MSRTVNVVYGDLSPGGSISSEFSEVIVCLSAAADAYERLIRERLLKEAVNKV